MPGTKLLLDIPRPDGHIPVLGHLRLIDRDAPVQSIVRLAATMGEIFAMDFPGGQLVVVSSQRLVNELCDESRFDKKVSGALYNIRDIAYDGLFTAHTREPNWQKAHDLLMPAFSMGAMANYFPMMLEVAEQLVGRWSALGPSDEVDVPDDMVRLTLETIGLCGFDFRFGSFTRSEPHPFVTSMLVALEEALARAIDVPLMTRLNVPRQRRYEAHVDNLKSVVDEVIAERKRAGAQSTDRDLLSLMLSPAADGQGQVLSDENIRYQIITFLIAGHETTSGLLSFAIYYLLKHPAVMARACAEVDAVFGTDPEQPPTLSQVGQMRYLRQILNEALRLFPPAPAFTLMPKEDTVLDGRFALRAGQPLMVLAGALHRDPTVWGDNPELFDPTHFAPEVEAARPANAFKPFGNGQRACIGRQFALQESVLALGMILQRFRLIDHRNYQLHIKESLTFKAEGFRIRVRPRTASDRAAALASNPLVAEPQAVSVPVADAGHGTPLLVLYGSNMGTAEQAARRLLEEGQLHGYQATLGTLDDYVGKLPERGLVLLVSASYNGKPPDNAAAFCEWISSAPGDLSNVRFAVFGLGNRDWATTYQRIPRLLDEAMAAAGAQRLLPRGEADAAGDFYGQVDGWFAGLWSQLAEQLGLTVAATVELGPRLDVELIGPVSLAAEVARNNELQPMTVAANIELVKRDTQTYGSKRHVTLTLPEGVTYKTGDHLLVMPQTPAPLVSRALARFQIEPTQAVVLSARYGDAGALPLGRPVVVADLLRYWLSLSEPATRRQVEALAAAASCPPDQSRLAELLEDSAAFDAQVRLPRVTVLDLLEELPSCEWTLADFLDVLPELQPRYYSIASAHQCSPHQVDLTVSVVDAPALSGRGRYQGAATTLLAGAAPGTTIYARVRAVDSNFLPPTDPDQPYLMIGAGTGVAPFRGFVQERIHRLETGITLAPAWLLFGARHPDMDYLYRDEFEAAEARGAVTMLTAFSRDPDAPCRYVQDRLRAESERLWPLIDAGALIYVCGDAQHMLEGVRQALADLYCEHTKAAAAVAQQWLTDLEVAGQLRIDAWS